MSDPQQQHAHAAPQHEPSRPAFAAPRLELPRFQLRPSTEPPLAARPQSTTPAPERQAPVATPTAPTPAPAYASAPAATAPAPAAPMPAYQATATALAQPLVVATAPAPAAPAPPPLRVAAAPMSNSTAAAPTSWNVAAPEPDKTLLQRISPVHMGVLMVIVMVMLVVTSGPTAMNAGPAKLAASVDGGGTAAGVPLPPRAGAVAIDAAKGAAPAKAAASPPNAGAAKPKAAAPAARPARAAGARVRTIKVGTARLRARVRAGGIPSPAAAANLAVAGGGRVGANQTGAVRLSGIPSPAAAEQLGPQKLPFRPTDGVTLPRMVGERDSHAVETHYGGTTLAMEEPAAPVMTPGAAAASAERQVTLNQLTGGTPSNPRPAAPSTPGYATAY